MRIALLRTHCLAVMLTAALLAGLAGNAFGAGLKAGDTFPDLGAFKLEGTVPSDLKGKVVMVDFWASWCDPCKESFPAMEELDKHYHAQGLVIVAVNVDEDRTDMQTFLKKHPATFAVVRDAGQKLVERAGIATMPSSFLVDRTGKIRFTHSGYKGAETKKQYMQEIESLLKTPAP